MQGLITLKSHNIILVQEAMQPAHGLQLQSCAHRDAGMLWTQVQQTEEQDYLGPDQGVGGGGGGSKEVAG